MARFIQVMGTKISIWLLQQRRIRNKEPAELRKLRIKLRKQRIEHCIHLQ